jgi:hypothetical protein
LYLIYLRVEPSAYRNWTIDETKFAAVKWARKFIELDCSPDLLHYEVYAALDNQILPSSKGYTAGDGLTIFIDKAPVNSRLRKKVQVLGRMMQLRAVA